MSHLRRGRVFLLAVVLFIPAGCFGWPEGAWQVEVEGWEGELVVEEGVEQWVFDLNATGPEGKVAWRGSVHRADWGLYLLVTHENGRYLVHESGNHTVPDYFRVYFRRDGDVVIGEILGTPLAFRKR